MESYLHNYSMHVHSFSTFSLFCGNENYNLAEPSPPSDQRAYAEARFRIRNKIACRDATMTPRERFSLTMSHKQPDRLPIDLGCTCLTGMTETCQRRLLDVLGFFGDGPKVNNGIDERLLKWAQADFRSVGGIVTLRSSLSKAISSTEFIDCWGVRRRLTGNYWEIVESPLVNASIQDIQDFPWPESEIDQNLLENWREEARYLA